MVDSEARVADLEDSLTRFLEEFELQNDELSICGKKLEVAERSLGLAQEDNS